MNEYEYTNVTQHDTYVKHMNEMNTSVMQHDT